MAIIIDFVERHKIWQRLLITELGLVMRLSIHWKVLLNHTRTQHNFFFYKSIREAFKMFLSQTCNVI